MNCSNFALVEKKRIKVKTQGLSNKITKRTKQPIGNICKIFAGFDPENYQRGNPNIERKKSKNTKI